MDSLTHGKTLSKKASPHEPISGRQVSELVEEALYTLYTAEDARALDDISDIFDAINRTKPGTLLKAGSRFASGRIGTKTVRTKETDRCAQR